MTLQMLHAEHIQCVLASLWDLNGSFHDCLCTQHSYLPVSTVFAQWICVSRPMLILLLSTYGSLKGDDGSDYKFCATAFGYNRMTHILALSTSVSAYIHYISVHTVSAYIHRPTYRNK